MNALSCCCICSVFEIPGAASAYNRACASHFYTPRLIFFLLFFSLCISLTGFNLAFSGPAEGPWLGEQSGAGCSEQRDGGAVPRSDSTCRGREGEGGDGKRERWDKWKGRERKGGDERRGQDGGRVRLFAGEVAAPQHWTASCNNQELRLLTPSFFLYPSLPPSSPSTCHQWAAWPRWRHAVSSSSTRWQSSSSMARSWRNPPETRQTFSLGASMCAQDSSYS